jgi:hypothetical protein
VIDLSKAQHTSNGAAHQSSNERIINAIQRPVMNAMSVEEPKQSGLDKLLKTAVKKRAWFGVLTLVLWVASLWAPQVSSGQAGSQAKAPDLKAIVQSMEAAEQKTSAKTRSYTVTRSYKLFHGDEGRPVSQTTAEISFVPPGTKKYEITQSSGTSRGQELVRDILKLETVPDQSSSDISQRNYTFVFLQEEKLGDVSCYLLRMLPKRKENNLLDGLVWVDTTTFLIQRIEGTPTKKPSWWLKNLDITLQYTKLNGLWLPTYIKATAVIRLAGSYLLTGEDVGIQTSASSFVGKELGEMTNAER